MSGIFQKIFGKYLPKTREFDPACFDDPVALQTEWDPISTGSTNGCPHELVTVTPDKMEFRGEEDAFIGISLIAMGCLIIVLVIVQMYQSEIIIGMNDLSTFMSSVLNVGDVLLEFAIGVLITAVGSGLFLRDSQLIVFDKRRAYFWIGSSEPEQWEEAIHPYCCVPIHQIHAIQLLSKYVKGSRSSNGNWSRGYYSYEINLVLADGWRTHVLYHGNLEKIQTQAKTLAQFLDKPLWNVSQWDALQLPKGNHATAYDAWQLASQKETFKWLYIPFAAAKNILIVIFIPCTLFYIAQIFDDRQASNPTGINYVISKIKPLVPLLVQLSGANGYWNGFSDTPATTEAKKLYNSTVHSGQSHSNDPKMVFRINPNVTASTEWQTAIKRAQSHLTHQEHHTLMRIVLDDAAAGETIQAQGLIFPDFTQADYGITDRHRTVLSGGFLLLSHIPSSGQRSGQNLVTFQVHASDSIKLWIDVPPAGELGVVGDIILSRPLREEKENLGAMLDALNVQKKKLSMGTQEESRQYTKLGLNYYRHKDYDGAVRVFHAAVVKDRTNYEAVVNLGLALFKQGKYEESIRISTSIVLAEQIPKPQRASAAFNVGKAYEALKNSALAYFYYQISTMINPNTARQSARDRLAMKPWATLNPIRLPLHNHESPLDFTLSLYPMFNPAPEWGLRLPESQVGYGVVGINIHRGKTFIQRIDVSKTLIQNIEASEIDREIIKWAQKVAFTPESKEKSRFEDFGIDIADFNFDGYTDFTVLLGIYGRNYEQRKYYLFQPSTRTFIESSYLSELPLLPQLNTEQKLLSYTAGGPGSGGSWIRDYYRWQEDTLVPVRHILVDRIKDDYIFTRKEWTGKQWHTDFEVHCTHNRIINSCPDEDVIDPQPVVWDKGSRKNITSIEND